MKHQTGGQCQWAQWRGLNTTVSSPEHRLWCLIAQRTLLGGRYAGDRTILGSDSEH